jgi:hypothetical protein
MARAYNIKDCERMIKQIKERQELDGNVKYKYWCPACDTLNLDDYCYCDSN